MSDIATHLAGLFSSVDAERNPAYQWAIQETRVPVPWAYEVWDRALEALTDNNNHVRSVASQILANLAISDPEQRLLRDFPALLAVTRDPRFVTARHCLQNIWRVGLAGPEHRALVLDGLRLRCIESMTEKNGTLIRYDIQVALANFYRATNNPEIKETALAWAEDEKDPKYRKKNLSAWKDV